MNSSGTSPLGMAVIGCGRISYSHVNAIVTQPQIARLVAAVDADKQRAEAYAKPQGALALTDLQEALDNPEVEAVAICLPNEMHAETTIAALRAGRHVLLEKPMAENAKQAARMAAVAEETGKILAIAQCRRQFGAIRALMDRRAEFGEIVSLQVDLGVKWHEAQAPWWRDREKAGGLVISLNGPHALDFVQMVMGAEPLRVHAESVRRQSFWSGEDEAMILLLYPGNRLASVRLSFNQDPVVNEKRLLFEKASVNILRDRELWVNGKLEVPADPAEDKDYLEGAIEFCRQLEEFAKAIAGRAHRSVLHQEGLHLTRLMDAVLEAAVTGKSIELG